MKFHPQAAGDRKAFPLGLSILWQHQQQRLVGTCTNWLNHGLMEPRWLLVLNSLSHRATGSRVPPLTLGFPGNVWRCWGCCQRRSSDSTQTFEARNSVAEPRKSFGGWAHCGMVNKLFAEAFLEDIIFKHIWSLEEQYIYIYVSHIHIYILYKFGKFRFRFWWIIDTVSGSAAGFDLSVEPGEPGQKPGTLTKLAEIAGIYDCSSPQLVCIYIYHTTIGIVLLLHIITLKSY